MPLGWNIGVYRQQNAVRLRHHSGRRPGLDLLWQTGVGGLKWLDDLVSQKKAVSLGGNGYPVEYTAMAGYIIPRLGDDPPGAKGVWTFDEGDVLLPGWLGQTTKDIQAMNACRTDEWLLIQAWDES